RSRGQPLREGDRFAGRTVSEWDPSGHNGFRVGPLWGKPRRGTRFAQRPLVGTTASRGGPLRGEDRFRVGPLWAQRFPGGTPLGKTASRDTLRAATARGDNRFARGTASRGGPFPSGTPLGTTVSGWDPSGENRVAGHASRSDRSWGQPLREGDRFAGRTVSEWDPSGHNG